MIVGTTRCLTFAVQDGQVIFQPFEIPRAPSSALSSPPPSLISSGKLTCHAVGRCAHCQFIECVLHTFSVQMDPVGTVPTRSAFQRLLHKGQPTCHNQNFNDVPSGLNLSYFGGSFQVYAIPPVTITTVQP